MGHGLRPNPLGYVRTVIQGLILYYLVNISHSTDRALLCGGRRHKDADDEY